MLGILGALLVPFIHLSVKMFRTLHPQPVVMNPEGPTLPGSMLATLLFSLAVMTLLYTRLGRHRYAQAERDEDRADSAADDAR